MSIKLNNTEIVEKFKDDEVLRHLLTSLSKAENGDTRMEWLKELKEKYPEVYDEYLNQQAAKTQELAESLAEKSLLEEDELEDLLLDELLEEEQKMQNK